MTGPIERAFARAEAHGYRRADGETSQFSNQVGLATENRNSNASSAADVQLTSGIQPVPTQFNVANHQIIERPVHVNTIAQRYKATQWMIDHDAENGDKHIISKFLKQLPQFFTGNDKANLHKGIRWWAKRSETMQLKSGTKGSGAFSLISARTGSRRAELKAFSGRGPKQSTWVTSLYAELLEEFNRLRSLGVKFNTSLLRIFALYIIKNTKYPCLHAPSIIHKGKPINEVITTRWIQRFMLKNHIVSRSQNGKLTASPQEEQEFHKNIAYHLGCMKFGFDSGQHDQNFIENADETHFIVNLDNGRTLGIIGDSNVKYAYVVSDGEPMTMFVRITGGKNAYVQPPFLIFKNSSGAYRIRVVPDDVPGASYRSSSKGWMDSTSWKQWLSERRAIPVQSGSKKRTLFVYNCFSHIESYEVKVILDRLRTFLKKLPPNSTDLAEPADSFVIQKIKECWEKRWNPYKYECIRKGLWKDGNQVEGSGKLPNPGKRFFLQLAANVIRDVKKMKDKNGILFVRKSMIMAGMALGPYDVWSEAQLIDQLREIVAKYRTHFEGTPVGPADIETESDSDNE